MGDRACKAFVLGCQAFVSNLEHEEEAFSLGNLPPLLPIHGPSPICTPPKESNSYFRRFFLVAQVFKYHKKSQLINSCPLLLMLELHFLVHLR